MSRVLNEQLQGSHSSYKGFFESQCGTSPQRVESVTGDREQLVSAWYKYASFTFSLFFDTFSIYPPSTITEMKCKLPTISVLCCLAATTLGNPVPDTSVIARGVLDILPDLGFCPLGSPAYTRKPGTPCTEKHELPLYCNCDRAKIVSVWDHDHGRRLAWLEGGNC